MSSIGSRRYANVPSPRGVHVPESYYASLDPDDPYRRPPSESHRNRYSHSVHQTPHVRDVTWISPNTVTPQTPHPAQSPWLVPSHAPSSAYRPPSPIPPSPVPTVGEHMALDEFTFAQDHSVDPYSRPQRRPSLIKSFWKGFKKLSGLQPPPSFPTPRPSTPYEIPAPVLSVPSEATQYVDPTPETSGTEEQRSTTPYTSPYVRPASIGATPAIIPSSLRASPAPIPPIQIPPPITIVSSIPSSPMANSIRSARVPSPIPSQRNLSMGVPEPVTAVEEGSQTLHEPVYLDLPPPVSTPVPIQQIQRVRFPTPMGGVVQATAVDDSSSRGSLSSTMGRFRRFVADLDDLPWVSDSQIADEYIPEENPRSRMRAKVRKGTEPSWYNPRPEIEEKPAYWSEWDMWAKQSTAALWDSNPGGRVGWAGVGAGGGLGQGQVQWGQWGMAYPHGYTPAQPGSPYPSGYPPGVGTVSGQGHAAVLQ